MKHFGRILLGYGAACLATAFGVTLAGTAYEFLNQDRVFGSTSLLLQSAALYALATAFLMVIPAVLVILVAELAPVRRLAYYATVGAVLGVAPGYLLSNGLHRNDGLMVTGLALGPIAGWIYRRIAGRHAGAWKRVES